MQTPPAIVPEWLKRCHLILLYAGKPYLFIHRMIVGQSAGNQIIFALKVAAYILVGSSETIRKTFNMENQIRTGPYPY